ncbi:hypothetical protein [Streptomyces sp. NPDC056304]|uniref:hypothetical protein n=1 Tax=Streptomyces sp. NPDC056304 TaxID=3345778 RepID=UPI0035DA0CC3
MPQRVLGRIEAHAPGLRALVTRWSAVGPAGITAADRNSARSDPYGGLRRARQLLGRAAQRRGLLAAGRTVLRRSLVRARFDPVGGQDPRLLEGPPRERGRADATVRCR